MGKVPFNRRFQVRFGGQNPAAELSSCRDVAAVGCKSVFALRLEEEVREGIMFGR